MNYNLFEKELLGTIEPLKEFADSCKEYIDIGIFIKNKSEQKEELNNIPVVIEIEDIEIFENLPESIRETHDDLYNKSGVYTKRISELMKKYGDYLFCSISIIPNENMGKKNISIVSVDRNAVDNIPDSFNTKNKGLDDHKNPFLIMPQHISEFSDDATSKALENMQKNFMKIDTSNTDDSIKTPKTSPSSQYQPSFGEKRVRTTFNPSDDSIVQNIKERIAEVINYINDNVIVPPDDGGEFGRLRSLAFTSLEEACMWAVKAATL